MTTERALLLGGSRPLNGAGSTEPFSCSPENLTTHGMVVGMTGSGKTGLLMVLIEEVLRSRVPVVMLDVKGDLPNLLLTFPELSAAEFKPWVDGGAARRAGKTPEELAAQTARDWTERLATWGLGPADVARFRETVAPRVLTPGSAAGEPLHVLSPLETPSPLWQSDVEVARESLSASISLLLRLLGRDPDPTRSRDHVVLSIFAERRLKAGQPADVKSLLADVLAPPVTEIGAMRLTEFLPRKERNALATSLNTLLASPTFESWRQGGALDVGQWVAPRADGRTPVVIVSVAHLDEDERAMVVGVVLDQVLAWVRSQSGTSELRALLAFDEVYGFVPPHPANPPAKRPLLALMKQARAFGLGVVLATQNPMDVDYRVLSNAGLWFVGRLQTDADRRRVIEAMADGGEATDGTALGAILKALAPRWFLVRDARRSPALSLVQSRTTLSWLRGPMTRDDLRRLGAPAGPTAPALPALAGEAPPREEPAAP